MKKPTTIMKYWLLNVMSKIYKNPKHVYWQGKSPLSYLKKQEKDGNHYILLNALEISKNDFWQ